MHIILEMKTYAISPGRGIAVRLLKRGAQNARRFDQPLLLGQPAIMWPLHITPLRSRALAHSTACFPMIVPSEV